MSNLKKVYEANNNGRLHQNDDKGIKKSGVIVIPDWMINSLHYEVITGSVAYGCNDVDKYDMDTVGFCMPKKNVIFPHLAGHITGFGKQPDKFEQWDQKHFFIDNKQEYDFAIYNIVKFFQLCMKNNPNIIDCLFCS